MANFKYNQLSLNKMPITWKDIKTFDDIILPQDKSLLNTLETELTPRCPHLKKEGKYFYYCGLDIPEKTAETPGPYHPKYENHVSTAELQIHCMEEYDSCCFYNKTLKR